MNERKVIMISCLIAAFLMLFTWLPKASFAESPPVPVVKFPFDVSRQDSTVNQEFRIRDYRSYYFAILFDYFGSADKHRVFALVGEGGRLPYGRYDIPGVIVPVHIKIIGLETRENPETVYDGVVETEGIYANSFERKQTDGHYKREIIVINLKPGIYRVEASTTKDSPEFAGTPSHLLIEYHSKLKFIPTANIPRKE